MDWGTNSNPALVEAIVKSFSDVPECSRRRLSFFSAEDWFQTEFWLDTSGLALYFLRHVRSKNIESAVDPTMLSRLDEKLASNKQRVADMRDEFVTINRAFQQAGVCYANLKGFTLFPIACPDATYRYQSDFDFLVDPDHLQLSRFLLEQRGYCLTGFTPRTLEFKTEYDPKSARNGQYKATQRRCAELHIGLEGVAPTAARGKRDARLNRLDQWIWNGESFPALSPVDQLIGQALHLLGHFRSEHTRPSWLLEYRHHVRSRRVNRAFWEMARHAASLDEDAIIAMGLSNLLAAEMFGKFSFPEFDCWTTDVLPLKVKVWAKRYAKRALLADIPGTKLYLLLDAALMEHRAQQMSVERIRRLVPLRYPPRVIPKPSRDTLWRRIGRETVQLQFIFFRLRFHIKQGLSFALELRRWNQIWKQRETALSPPECPTQSTISSSLERSQDAAEIL
jgi:hypothetical protein